LKLQIISYYFSIKMPRLYHVDIARHATGAHHKWVDNLLSHFSIPGVEGGTQGLPRRISPDGIKHIALVRILTRDAGISVSAAVPLAARLLGTHAAEVELGRSISLRLDVEQFDRDIRQTIADAVESVTPARRGRPRRAAAP
jgi:hypothetical protein